jgi:predicted aspartyl protease
MRGIINQVYEATISLTVFGPGGESKEVTAVIDTGYNGMLSLPLAIVQELHLLPHVQRVVTLGDRSQKILDFYQGEILWAGDARYACCALEASRCWARAC